MAEYASLIPVNVITGFLGSGKTTVLRQLLASPQLHDTAVLINEFGEVGLDHHLLQRVDESTVLLQSGCICCTIRGDLQTSIRDLFSRRERGEVPPFRRLAIETTGLADPAPILYTILADPVIQHHFRLGNIVTTVDAVNAPAQLERHPETAKQIAVADRLILTKTDLAEAAAVESLEAKLRAMNPSAPLVRAADGPLEPDSLLTSDIYEAESRTAEIRRWVERALKPEHRGGVPHGRDANGEYPNGHDPNRHGEDIEGFCITFEQPLDWSAFGIWLTMLLQRHGERVLRVKGILNTVDMPTPVVVHGVQHIVHPPVHLDAWPDAERRSRIVFIVQGIPRQQIEASLAAFNAMA